MNSDFAVQVAVVAILAALYAAIGIKGILNDRIKRPKKGKE